jgi:hypothetical protein
MPNDHPLGCRSVDAVVRSIREVFAHPEFMVEAFDVRALTKSGAKVRLKFDRRDAIETLEPKQLRPCPQYDVERLLAHFPEGEVNALSCLKVQRRIMEDEGISKRTFCQIKEDLVARGLVKTTIDGLLFR